MSAKTLGVVGLGRMGNPLAGRLVAAGYRVLGFDAAGTEERLPNGAWETASVQEMAAQAEVMLLSLPSGAASEAVCERVAGAPRRRTRAVVDLSTIGITAAERCAARLESVDVAYVDAPVSGGVAGARTGALTIMIGAPSAAFAMARPLLEILGKHCFHVGERPGLGQVMKLLNNYISAAALAATAEATVFGARLGLDLAQMIEIINLSTGRTSASTDKFPRSVLPRSYDFGFAGALMTKDVLLYLENAEQAGAPHELADSVAAIWERFNRAHPQADFTYIHKHLEDGGR